MTISGTKFWLFKYFWSSRVDIYSTLLYRILIILCVIERQKILISAVRYLLLYKTKCIASEIRNELLLHKGCLATFLYVIS